MGHFFRPSLLLQLMQRQLCPHLRVTLLMFSRQTVQTNRGGMFGSATSSFGVGGAALGDWAAVGATLGDWAAVGGATHD